jgi:hypothetical protein
MKYKFLIPFLAVMAITHTGTARADYGGQYCREYTKTIRVGGVLKSAYGTACLQPDGDWKIVSLRGPDRLYDDIRREARRDKPKIIVVKNYRPHYAGRYPLFWYSDYRGGWRPYYHSRSYSHGWNKHHAYGHHGNNHHDNDRHGGRGRGRH